MPQVGLHCVRGDMPHDACRACALNPLHPCMMTPDMLEKLREQPGKPGPKFSPTRILGCQRREQLQASTDYYTDVDDSYPLVRGRMVHALMEDSRYPGALGVLREVQLWTTVDTRFGPQRFESTIDLVVVKSPFGPNGELNTYTCKVVDYKTASRIGHDMTAAHASHIAQVNIYRWMLARELPAKLWPDCAVEVDELEVEYCGIDKPRRFTSAGPLTARGKMLTRKPRTYETLTLAPIPIWPLDKVEAAVVRRIEQRLEHEAAGTLPPVLPEEDQWMCERCPVNAVCWARWRQEGE